mgnify:CR=1 FL=1
MSKIVIIGAGLSGFILAQMLMARGMSFVILDQSDDWGGVWKTSANESSQVQVDPLAYTSCLAQQVYPPYARTADVLSGLDVFTKEIRDRIVFGAKVTQIVSRLGAHALTIQETKRTH